MDMAEPSNEHVTFDVAGLCNCCRRARSKVSKCTFSHIWDSQLAAELCGPYCQDLSTNAVHPPVRYSQDALMQSILRQGW